MNVQVNGKPHKHQGSGSVGSLLEELGAHPAHTALMINGDVVPSEQWATMALKENDEIEMLVFVGGG